MALRLGDKVRGEHRRSITRPNSQAASSRRDSMEVAYTLPRAASKEDPLRLAVFISGSGSGLAALLKYQQSQSCPHQTVLVLADSLAATGLEHGRNSGVKSVGIPLPDIIDRLERRQSHEELVEAALIDAQVECIVLSGYMRILTPNFVRKWKGRLINIHPSLLPKYPGAHAHRDALADGATVSGCSVHLVDEGVDSGMILAQQEVPVLEGDTESDLQERIKKVEHVLYPIIIDKLATGSVSL